MQLIIEANEEELEELAKMAYVAQFVFDSSGEHSTGYKYPHMQTVNSALRIINKALLPLIPHSHLLEVDGHNDNVFTHSIEMEKHCSKLIETYAKDCYLERICGELTTRDYIEKGGNPDTEQIILGVSEVFTILYNKNMAELKQYGLSRFRLEK